MRGCVLPRLPAGGERLDCAYVEDLKVECSLTCEGQQGHQRTSYCYLYQGQWRGRGLSCRQSQEPVRPLESLASCLHSRQTGCLLPPRLELGSQLECGVVPGETWCRVVCSGEESQVWAYCLQDTSGWLGRWSRILLPCSSSGGQGE